MNHLFLYEAFWEAPEQSLPSIFWKAFITSLRDMWYSYPTLCDPMDYTVHGILQASILEWVAYPFSRGSSRPRNWARVSCIAGRFFTSWANREALRSRLNNAEEQISDLEYRIMEITQLEQQKDKFKKWKQYRRVIW